MKLQPWSFFAFLALLCAFSATSAFAQETSSCSLATLNGSYGYTIHGEFIVPASKMMKAAVIPLSGTAVSEFDGKGHIVSHRDTINVNGKVSRRRGTGSYLVNADCTGSAELHFPDPQRDTVHVDLVIVDGGKRIYNVVTDPNNSVIATGVKM